MNTTKMKKKLARILKPVPALLFLVLTMGMTSADENEKVRDCASRAGDGAIYLKEFIVSLPKAEQGQRPPMYRQAVILRGNNIYRFNLCNEKGKAVIRVYDSSNMLLSSYDQKSGKEYNPINFMCRKTGQYNIIITTQDGSEGEAVGIMSHVQK